MNERVNERRSGHAGGHNRERSSLLDRLPRRQPKREQRLELIRQRRVDLEGNLSRLRESMDREFQIFPKHPKSVMSNLAIGTVLALIKTGLRRHRERQKMRISVRPTRDTTERGMIARFLRYLAWHILFWRRSTS